jgi:hypothetical protein
VVVWVRIFYPFRDTPETAQFFKHLSLRSADPRMSVPQASVPCQPVSLAMARTAEVHQVFIRLISEMLVTPVVEVELGLPSWKLATPAASIRMCVAIRGLPIRPVV